MTAHAGEMQTAKPTFANITTWLRRNPPLAALVVAMLALLAVAIVGLVIDPRIITGAPAWLKPAKFAISIAIYGATLIWLLQFVTNRPRLIAIVSWLLLLMLGAEMVLITLQVLRGTTSHFNYATPFDAAVFAIMAGAIVVVWLLTLLVGILLFRRNFAAPAIVWGMRMGVITALLGMAVAFLMPQPTPAQEELMDASGSSSIVGAHAVGVEDGGPGLPIVGWSTTGGDLRVPHFIGMHGLQVLPLFGGLLASFAPAWVAAKGRARLVIVAGLAWLGLTIVLTWQALRGQPLIAPDGQTLAAFGAVLGAALVMAIVILGQQARGART